VDAKMQMLASVSSIRCQALPIKIKKGKGKNQILIGPTANRRYSRAESRNFRRRLVSKLAIFQINSELVCVLSGVALELQRPVEK
jgi:hypothetical protein